MTIGKRSVLGLGVRSLSGLAVVLLVLGFLPSGRTQNAASGILDNPDYGAIDRYVEDQMKDCRIPGFALAIVRGDEVLYLKGYGIADETDRPVTAQTPFRIASVSKTFTALALMQLEDGGRVDLDATVSRYLPDLGSALGVYEQMTIRQLLNHTAGFDAQLEYQVTSPEAQAVSIRDLVSRFSTVPLSHAPGVEFEYNNAGYIVLGEVISQVSGFSYADYLQRNILDPLEMHHTFTSMDSAAGDAPAVGYRTLFGFPRVSGLTVAPAHVPAFGLLSSAEDLSHYMIAMLNGGLYEGTRVLSEENVAEMLTPSAAESAYVSYGLGWYVTSGSFYHGGELTDYQAKVKVLPEDELGVAFLINTSSSTANELFDVGYRDRIETGIINILYGVPPTDQPGRGVFSLSSYPMTLTYYVMVGLPVLVILLLGVSAYRVRTMSERLGKSRCSFWWNVICFTLVNALLPLYILTAVPRRSVSWAYMVQSMPDVGWFALILSLLLMMIGICKVSTVAVFLKDGRYPQY